MDRLSFKLETFEGPLDLMLTLISKHKLNVNDIEISKLLEQYIDYLDRCQSHDLELAGEFLEMAARLIYIKTTSLLPNHTEAEQIKRELEGTLIEYSLYKEASKELANMYRDGEVFSHIRIESTFQDSTYDAVHSPQALLNAYMDVRSNRLKRMKPSVSEDNFKDIVSHRVYPVEVKVVSVLKTMYRYGRANIGDLFDAIDDRSERVALFLAILELTKSGRLLISDTSEEILFTGKKSKSQKTHLP